MMKNLISILTAMAAILVIACSKPQGDGSDPEEWKELDDFHMIIAEVYHPLKDSGDVGPITLRAVELADAAEKWQGAELPEKVNNDEVKGLLVKLKDGTRDLANSVASGAGPDEVGADLTAQHELFHRIMEQWYKPNAHEHH